MKSQVWRERAVYGSGIAAPIVTLGGAAVASQGYAEPYSMLNQTISALGVAAESAWHPLFNTSMILGAILLTIFTVGTSIIVGSRPGYAVAAAAVFANTGMAFVGLYPANPETAREHLLAAALAFTGILCLSASFSVFIRVTKQDILPRWLAYPALLNVLCTIAFFAVLAAHETGKISAATPRIHWISALEWSVLLTIMAWAFLVALTLRTNLKQRRLNQGQTTN
jgi:hypothetical membrane protein